ncbi:MAG: hypothetical protein ABIK28_03320, partial [Planctomycetota bacterium]
MQLLTNMKISTRLLSGFIACALITGLCALLGITALNQLCGHTEEARNTIKTITSDQSRQNRNMADLRSLISAINSAKGVDELKTGTQDSTNLHNRLNNLRACWNDDTAQEVIDIVEQDLIGNKSRLLTAGKQLKEILSQLRTDLSQVNSETKETTNQLKSGVETALSEGSRDTQEALITNARNISERLESFFTMTSEALATIRQALLLRSLGRGLEADVKDALLTDEPEEVRYARSDTKSTLESIKSMLPSLPSNEKTGQLQALLSSVSDHLDS